MKILILNAHPYKKSFSDKIADKYFAGAKKAKHNIKRINIRDLKFDPNLKYGYHEIYALEDDLKKQQELIKWCEHLVIITPLWWGGLPAIFKGYIDRTLLPGFAFKYKNGKLDRLLKGRSARVIYTQGGSRFISHLFMLDSFWRILKRETIWFCGFSPVKRLIFPKADRASDERRKRFLNKIYKLGLRGK
jgi:NAD(P)H dehydrogenase (quinone)